MSDTSTVTRKAPRRPRPAARLDKAGQKETPAPGHSLPVLVPEVHVRHVPLPRIDVTHVPVPHMRLPVSDAVRSRLPEPSTNRLLWFGGLAGLAALGVIEWPVAGVVAAGTYVAERRAKAARHDEPVSAGRRRPARATAQAGV